MKNKKTGIKLIEQIQNGLFDRNAVEIPKGRIAERYWDHTMFTYGMEYGAMWGIMKVLNITEKDLTTNRSK